MRSTTKSGITALTAAIALALGAAPFALVAPSLVGSGTPTTIGPATASPPPAGTLTLATTSEQGTVTWSESDEVTQAFTGGQFCAITDTPGSDELLRLSGTLGTGTTARDGIAGFRGGEVGVFEFDNASQCFRVDAGSFTATETLVLALGGDLRDTFGQLLATSATFGLTKQPGDLEVTWSARLDGTQVGTGTWTSPRQGNKTAVATTPITPTSAFDEVRLTAIKGSFALRTADFSLVSLADATFCDPGTVDSGTVPGAVSTLTEDNTTVSYLGNVSGGTSCFGVRLTSGPQAVQFRKPLTVARDAEFIFDTAWELDATGEWTPEVTLPGVFIDFELRFDEDGDPIAAEHALPFCPIELFDEQGDLVGLQGVDPADVLPDWEDEGIPGDEGTQYACIGNRTVNAVVPFTVTDQIYLIGDAKMRL